MGIKFAGPINRTFKLMIGNQAVTDVVIPSGTESILANLACCATIKSVVLPDSVTSISASAFYKCTSLREINIPEGVKCIPESAFSGCTNLQSISIPKSVTKIENNAFSGCNLKSFCYEGTANEWLKVTNKLF